MDAPVFHVAVGVHNRSGYFVHALVTLHSVFARSGRPVVAHVLHDATLENAEKRYFRAVGALHGGEIHFHDLSSRLASLPGLPALEHFSVGCLFRLFLPEVLPEAAVLYLDSDVCAATDPGLLFRAGLETGDGGPALWAVRDSALCRPRFRTHVEHLLGGNARYFNSGVLLFHCGVVNARLPNFTRRALALLGERPGLNFPDQDVLNLLFADEGMVGLLPARANYQIDYGARCGQRPERLEGMLVHYTWHKPWQRSFPAGLLYWRCRERLFAALGWSGPEGGLRT